MESIDNPRNFGAVFWLFFLTFVGIIFVINFFQIQNPISSSVLTLENIKLSENNTGFLIKTKGCRIPDIDPFDPSIKQFVYSIERPNCNNGKPPLVEDDFDSIRINEEAISYYSPYETLKCCYKAFFRKKPNLYDFDNKVRYINFCEEFNGTTNITQEYIEVTCKSNEKEIYKDYFAFVPTSHLKIKNNQRNLKDKFNILIIGLDGVSRMNLHRQMPKTVNVLKKLSAIEFFGYNKVGDNTFPNLIPVLSGLNEKEFEPCWQKTGHFDNCSLIWKNFHDDGYVTAFGEDSAWIGIFNYVKKGFIEQPTDYYWDTFSRHVERKIGNVRLLNVDQCVGSREIYRIFLKYLTKYTKKMYEESLRYFLFFWSSSLTHDFFNQPKLGDDDYARFFEELKSNGQLNDTILIWMSDHGIRWGGIRQTFIGMMEERLPFLFVVLPERFKAQYWQAYVNMMKNSRRLITPFDLHETLKDLLDPSQIFKRKYDSKIAYSLFQQIPLERTCTDAGIESHWCTCLSSFHMNVNKPVVVRGALYAVNTINGYLEGYKSCAKLHLKNVKSANLMSYTKDMDYKVFHHFLLTFETTPGDGVFEATIRVSKQNKTTKYDIMGTISRLNLYGHQSYCINDFHLKLYCYCDSYF